jgi:hypothetical protein
MINQPIGRCVSDFIVNVLSRGGGFKSEDNNADVCQLGGLARICLKQAREAKNPIVSAELKHLAKGYQLERRQWIMESFPTSEKRKNKFATAAFCLMMS